MLDTSHPKSKYIFEASALEDSLRADARILPNLPSQERLALLTKCLQTLDALRRLNQEQFDASPFLHDALNEAQEALEQVTHVGNQHDSDLLMKAIAKMDSPKGFGTCFI